MLQSPYVRTKTEGHLGLYTYWDGIVALWWITGCVDGEHPCSAAAFGQQVEKVIYLHFITKLGYSISEKFSASVWWSSRNPRSRIDTSCKYNFLLWPLKMLVSCCTDPSYGYKKNLYFWQKKKKTTRTTAKTKKLQTKALMLLIEFISIN